MSERNWPGAQGFFWRHWGFWRGVAVGATGLWLSVALGFATTAVLARALGPHGFGAYALAMAVVATANALLDVPLEEAAVHYASRALEGRAPRSAHLLLRRSLACDLTIGLIVAGAVVAVPGHLARVVSGGWLDPALVRLAALAALAQTVDGTTSAALLLEGRVHTRAWLLAGANVLRLVFVGGAAAMTRSPAWALSAAAVAATLASLLQGWAAWRLGWREWRCGARRAELEVAVAPMIGFGLRTAVASTISGARNGVLPVLLGRFGGPEAVSLFEVATFPLQAGDVASAPVRLALFPEQARIAATGAQDELRAAVRAHVRAGILLGVPAAVAGWILLPYLIPALYSSQYGGAVTPARILLVPAVVALALGWSKTLPAALGRPELRVHVLAVDAVVVVGVLWAVGSSGATGAAVALTLGLLAQAVAWALLFRKLFPSSGGATSDRGDVAVGAAVVPVEKGKM